MLRMEDHERKMEVGPVGEGFEVWLSSLLVVWRRWGGEK